MSSAVDIEIKCSKKVIVITWTVLISGGAASLKLAKDVKKQFYKSFNNNKKYFKIGDCFVIFMMKAKYRKDRTWHQSDVKNPNRDLIIIEDHRAGGGGAGVPGGFVLIHPRTDNKQLDPWKTENELGHGLGLMDRGKGKQGEWNYKGIKPHHIARIFFAHALKAKSDQLKRCCGTTIEEAITPPGIHIEEAKSEVKKATKSESKSKGETIELD